MEVAYAAEGAIFLVGYMNYEAYRILIVDENRAERELARLVLANELPGISVREVETSTDFAEGLAREQFDVAITERRLSWGDGIDIVRVVRRIHARCAIILFTAEYDPSAVRWTLEQRPDEYVVKNGAGYLQLSEAVRRQLERRLSSNTRASGLISRLPVGIFALSEEGRIVFANAAAARLFDMPVAKVIGNLLTAFFADSIAQDAIQEAILSQKGLQGLEGRLIRQDAPHRWVRLWLWNPEDDQEVALEGLLEDISDLKARENRHVSQARQIPAVSTERERFASTVAHELQAPMGRITRYAQLLVDRHAGAFEEDARRFLSQILDDGRRLQEMLDDLLSYARVGAGGRPFQPVDFGAAVDEAAANLEEMFKDTGGTLRRDDLPVLLADRAQVIRLFQNLIGNALKYHGLEAPEVQVSASESRGDWLFAVKDNGIGIGAADRERVFELFQRLPQTQELPGTGIGLTICRSIVEHHGGRIWVEPDLDQGSTLYFTMPGDKLVRSSEHAENE
jgi:PAS domain S-box-containing protein